jgi:maltoporin
MKLVRSLVITITIIFSLPALADKSYSKYSYKMGDHEVGSKGWFRLGIGGNIDNKQYNTRNCYKAKGARAKYRMGNECDNEITFGVYDRYSPDGDNGIYLHSQLDLKYKNVDQHIPMFDKIDAAYMELGNIETKLGKNKIWVGKREYSLHKIEMDDFNLIDMAGKGGGIGDIDLNFAKFSYAYLESDDNFVVDKATSVPVGKMLQNNHDFRLTDIKANKDAKITLWYTRVGTREKKAVTYYPFKKGNAYGIFHQQDNFLGEGGENKLSFEYGNGLMYDFKGKDFPLTIQEANKFSNSHTYRATNSNIFPIGDKFSLATVLIWERTIGEGAKGADLQWRSAGMRPMYHINDNYRIAFEYGHDYVKDKLTPFSGALNKYTLAVEYTIEKGFKAKPLARVFITRANWGRGLPVEIKKDVFSLNGKGTTFGVQFMYAW